MFSKTRWLVVCLVIPFAMAMAGCGGGDGKCAPTDPTCGGPPPPPTFSYSLSNSGAVSAQKGSSTVSVQSTISKTLTSGSTRAVSLAVSGLPSGVTATLTNGDCSPTCSTTVNFTVEPSTAVGSYSVTVTGSPNDVTTSFTLSVTAPPVQNTRDTIYGVFAPADSFDVAPVGVFVDFISTDSVSAPYSSWYAGTGLSVPKGASGRLCIRGGDKYESRCWNVTASAGFRFARTLHPKCFTGRRGVAAGQTRCLSSAALRAVPGGGDNFSFFRGFSPPAPPPISPWGWAGGYPAKIYLVGQNWSSADSARIASVFERLKTDRGWQVAIMAGRANDTLPVVGAVKIGLAFDPNRGNGPSFVVEGGEIRSCFIHMASITGDSNLNNVAHEFMHCMGIGHGSQWLTWMISASRKDMWSPTNWFTVEDFIAFELLEALRAQDIRLNANLSWF